MVGKLFVLLIMLNTLNASSFEENCLKCHFSQRQLSMFMRKYTLKYSSEAKIKQAVYDYLKHPSPDKSILPFEYLRRFGIKDKSTLNDTELHEMVKIYYERFNIKSKIY